MMSEPNMYGFLSYGDKDTFVSVAIAGAGVTPGDRY